MSNPPAPPKDQKAAAAMEDSKEAALKTTGEDQKANETEEKAPAKESKYHRGKWTNEECEYMLALMEAFKAGQLPLREGTTLRSFLSSMMKCKPKRISKKFEGISYNGRMVYQRSKEPVTLQAAMLLRARLSELERRYLAAAAEQREGGESIDALLSQGPLGGLPPPEGSIAALAAPAPDKPPAIASLPVASLPRDSEIRSAARLPQASLGLLSDQLGIKADASALLVGGQANLRDLGLPAGGLRNSLDPALLNSAAAAGAGGHTSLISAGLAAGSDALRNIHALRQPQQAADFPALSSTNSVLGDFHAHLRELDQQQQLASMSNANAASALATIQLRERALAAQLSQASTASLGLPLGAQGLPTDVLPSVSGLNAAAGQLPTLAGGGGLTGNNSTATHNDAASALNPAVQHSLDLNRFVLQAPQDDASYFRQRLLPGVNSLTNPLGETAAAAATVNQPGLTTQDLLQLQASAANNGGISELLKRKLQENELQDSRALKRQR